MVKKKKVTIYRTQEQRKSEVKKIVKQLTEFHLNMTYEQKVILSI